MVCYVLIIYTRQWQWQWQYPSTCGWNSTTGICSSVGLSAASAQSQGRTFDSYKEPKVAFFALAVFMVRSNIFPSTIPIKPTKTSFFNWELSQRFLNRFKFTASLYTGVAYLTKFIAKISLIFLGTFESVRIWTRSIFEINDCLSSFIAGNLNVFIHSLTN